MKTQNKFTVQKLAVVGLMAAMVYVATNFRIDIPTPMGKTMLHLGNVMCILSDLLFGGPVGGLAAGIGSAFFDLLDQKRKVDMGMLPSAGQVAGNDADLLAFFYFFADGELAYRTFESEHVWQRRRGASHQPSLFSHGK